MTLLVMAAGMGSRYGGLKQIDPITDSGNFILDFSVYDAMRAGFNKVVFVIKEENEEIFRETIGQRIENKIKTEYVFQSLDSMTGDFIIPTERVKPWGTGHAVLCASDVINEPFAVINADDFYGRDAFEKLSDYMNRAEKGEKNHYCMAGYLLKNTLTENGTVARGQCITNNNDMLESVTERTKIEPKNGGVVYYDEDENGIQIPLDTIVSMNCWGFTPAFFDSLRKYFNEFLLDPVRDRLKGEFYLPSAVTKAMNEGNCDVKVLTTTAKWYGVTYHDDKPGVVASIKSLIDSGEYPKHLWN